MAAVIAVAVSEGATMPMTAVRFGPRFVSAAVLIGALMCTTAACGTEASTSSGSAEGTEPKSAIGQSEITWEEPASYAYTLTSSEPVLHGTFRVTVRDGKAAKAVGLDEEGTEPRSATTGSDTTWEEPSSYTYTLKSSEGERTLLGTFRVTVRNGKVAEAVGLDGSGRRLVKELPGEVPTIGKLLEEMEQARRDRADVAEAEYAADGHPVRISLDWEKDAIDDEALYVISAYEPAKNALSSRRGRGSAPGAIYAAGPRTRHQEPWTSFLTSGGISLPE
jgi:hypothetical protein